MAVFFLATALLLYPVQAFAAVPDEASGAAKIPHRVPRVEAEVRVDGVLDDAPWQQALVLELAYEVEPGENIPAPVRTEVLLAYGTSHLYVAFRAWDPDPSAISARLSDRDEIWDDDWVEIILDTFNDERRTTNFGCSPFGIQADLIASPDGGGETWDAIWDSAGRISATGYAVEMAIPFSSLRFQRTPGDQTWGVDAVRSYPREVRHELALFPRDRGNNCYMCQSEKLIGFAAARPGKNLEIDSTYSAMRTEEREDTEGPFVERDRSSELGLTTHWGVTPNLTASATLHPDFSQVEADSAQLDVNLQFALFYPEKRPFFLEGADLFSTRLNAVHTRTLIDPSWGMKLTGKEGRSAIGAFIVEDEITNLLLPGSEASSTASLATENTSSVLRYRRDVGRSSTLGIVMTAREADEYSNRVLGLDGDLRITPKDRLQVQFLGSRTRYPDPLAAELDQPAGEFDGTALDVFYVHATRHFAGYVLHQKLDPGFRADLGFLPKVGYRHTNVGFRHAWYHDPGHWYTVLKVRSSYEIEDDHAGRPLFERFTAGFDYAGPYRSYFNIRGYFGNRFFNGVGFDNDFAVIEAGLWPTGSLALSLQGTFGDEIDYLHTRAGKLVHLDPGIEYRIGRHLTLRLDHSFERLDVEGGRLYEANVSRLRTVYQFTRRSFLRTILQYVDYEFNPDLYTVEVASRSKHLFSQVLYSYKINPQTVLFLGYSDNHYGDQDLHLTQTDRTVFLKLGYAWVL
ncbi:MAG: carbohydrate binding family 9 domain-containing protein [bacterium]|nr:carbohydrate binding family 9 domain-containing protein [bacterium]